MYECMEKNNQYIEQMQLCFICPKSKQINIAIRNVHRSFEHLMRHSKQKYAPNLPTPIWWRSASAWKC